GIAVYYTIGRSRDIRIIPATLGAVAILTFAAPWGAYQVSIMSQRHRLDALIARYALHPVTTGAVAKRDVPFADREQIAATLRYLLERHDPRGLAARFGHVAPWQSRSAEPRVRTIMASLGVAYVSRWETETAVEHFSFSASSPDGPVRIDGYQYA